MAARECQWLGVAMTTASMSLLSRSFADVVFEVGLLAVLFLEFDDAAVEDGLIGVAEADDFGVRLLHDAPDVVTAAAVGSNDGNAEFAVGGHGVTGGEVGGHGSPGAEYEGSAAAHGGVLLLEDHFRVIKDRCITNWTTGAGVKVTPVRVRS
jgi:hypothetical protein